MNARFVAFEDDYVVGVVDTSVYGLTPLLKTAYDYTGSFYVHLQHGAVPNQVDVRLRSREGEADLEAAFGRFMNDLLDHCLRAQIAAETEPVRNLILAHALSGTSLIGSELEAVEPGADPLGIGKPDDGETSL